MSEGNIQTTLADRRAEWCVARAGAFGLLALSREVASIEIMASEWLFVSELRRRTDVESEDGHGLACR
jgi:hypothetical protein